MSTTILNFKSITVTAASKEEAIAEIEEKYFHVNGDATQAYRNAKSKFEGVWSERDDREFKLNYLEKKVKSCPGAGFLITVESAVADTRERPYKFENVKNEGKRKYKTMFKWLDRNGNTIITVDTHSKTVANNALKELYKNGKFKGDATLIKTKEVTEGNAVVSKATYCPSKNTKKGTWVAFGIEAC